MYKYWEHVECQETFRPYWRVKGYDKAQVDHEDYYTLYAFEGNNAGPVIIESILGVLCREHAPSEIFSPIVEELRKIIDNECKNH